MLYNLVITFCTLFNDVRPVLQPRELGCKISGFHGGDYEEWRFLGCYAVWLL
jgi:hypothetical protein